MVTSQMINIFIALDGGIVFLPKSIFSMEAYVVGTH